jgi:hypothetical protein
VQGDQQLPGAIGDLGWGRLDETMQPVSEDAGEGGGHGGRHQRSVRGSRAFTLDEAAGAQIPVQDTAERSPATPGASRVR